MSHPKVLAGVAFSALLAAAGCTSSVVTEVVTVTDLERMLVARSTWQDERAAGVVRAADEPVEILLIAAEEHGPGTSFVCRWPNSGLLPVSYASKLRVGESIEVTYDPLELKEIPEHGPLPRVRKIRPAG